MAFLDLIAGKKGENLTSEILKYLLLNSEPFRKKLIARISKCFAPTDVPQFLNGANCFTEYGSDGFIDVLLIADNAILIIENKLWHSFEPNQPVKYESFMREHSGRFGRSADECQIIVLHPNQRNAYVKAHLATQRFEKKPIQLTWKDVQSDLKSVRAESSEMVRVVSDLLCEYLDFQIGVYSELNIPRERIIGEAVMLGNQYQRDFLGRLSTGFKDKTTNIRFGKTYGGFYFRFAENQSRHQNWFGFHKRENGIALECHATITDTFDDLNSAPNSTEFRFNPAARSEFVLDFAPWPQDRAQWQTALDEFLKFIEERSPVQTEISGDDNMEEES